MSILFFRVFGRRLAGNQNRYMVLSCKNYFCKTNREKYTKSVFKTPQKTGRKYRFYSQFFYAFLLVKLKKM